ncbi:TlyA family RNA methyltransferase [Parasphaerochaeta coccoides]|uniref:Hemolysin A n=1 Tax=Parasphaerochaeta coccoides (strain ATCC BAA-1237 / DSM 17374 / SPN1) TaxID=760011 RepID=F4GKK2_PARC1|nr:TlyA family RNA methyltransferase [Parasphaerochaeta coccoides]AEC02885.1 hemolysin A [Parasphaerochaeta coccoides DSM 17374]
MAGQSRHPFLVDVLVRRFPQHDRQRLRGYIACGNVMVDGARITDEKACVPASAEIALEFPRYVSRGGYKLEKALDAFSLSVSGLVMLDAGASTGGFTDCLLQHGAACVHSVDVGYNQLDWKLRTDSRVIVHEKQNIMTVEVLEPPADAAVCDLSFRSIAGAASHILSLTKMGWLVALVKPQFETPKNMPGFTGVVREETVLRDVMAHVHDILEADGVGVRNIVRSPLEGLKGGNTEFLVLLVQGKGMDKDAMLSSAFVSD